MSSPRGSGDGDCDDGVENADDADRNDEKADKTKE